VCLYSVCVTGQWEEDGRLSYSVIVEHEESTAAHTVQIQVRTALAVLYERAPTHSRCSRPEIKTGVACGAKESVQQEPGPWS